MKRQFLGFAATLLLVVTLGVLLARPTVVNGSATAKILRVAPRGVKCPICGASAYFTGKTKVDVSGKLLKLYRCMRFRRHEFWVVAN